MRDNESACLSRWFPILEQTGVLVPKTKIIKTDVELISLLDGQKPVGYDEFMAMLRQTILDNGLPAFLRTGQTSGKHYWKKTCYVTDINKLWEHVAELVEFSALADFIGLPSNVWVVREFLELETSFAAFMGDMPVNKEMRYFIRDGEELCAHAYWPEFALEEGGGPKMPADWKHRLSELNMLYLGDCNHLEKETAKIAAAFPDYWSLDWAKTKDGRWFAIDMAPGDMSFHDPSCEFCSEEMRKQYQHRAERKPDRTLLGEGE